MCVQKHWINLGRKPLDKNKIIVKFSYPNPKLKGYRIFFKFPIDRHEIYYRREADDYLVGFDVQAINEFLEGEGVAEDMKVRIDVIYPIK